MKPPQQVNEWIHRHFDPMEVIVEPLPLASRRQQVMVRRGIMLSSFLLKQKIRSSIFSRFPKTVGFRGIVRISLMKRGEISD